jgi:hypothetical protein
VNVRKFLLILVAVFLVSLFSYARVSAQKPTAASINSYVDQVNRFVRSHRGRIFANTASEDSEQDNWREFKSVAQLKKSESAFEQAHVWLRAKSPVTARFALTSPSGDWFQYVYYYFREDGSLAKIQSELNTFHGNLTVITNRIYDVDGKLLQVRTKYLDLKSHKPTRSRDFMDQEIPLYVKARDLPFYNLL